MNRLLAPTGCPWDREQTLDTLRPFLVEETYEVLDALSRGDVAGHCEELGDLLRPLPGVRHGDEIVALLSTHGPTIGHTISPPDIADYNGLTGVFAGVIGSQITPACLTIDQELYWVYGQIATANFFDVLGVKTRSEGP